MRHLAGRLVSVIEDHAEALTRDTVKRLQSSEHTSSYKKLPSGELSSRVNQLYENLGRWLWENSDRSMQAWYNKLGEKRCSEDVPLEEVLWALFLTKYQLVNYLDACAPADSAMEMYRKQEFERMVGQFFDRAACYAAEGYEREASAPETR